MPSCVAPPAINNAAVALPCWILFTRLAFVVVGLGTRHTLASYLSMHPAPDTTASTGHFVSGPLGGATASAAPASSTSAAATAIFAAMCLIGSDLLVGSSFRAVEGFHFLGDSDGHRAPRSDSTSCARRDRD